jgi:hypothetical protein
VGDGVGLCSMFMSVKCGPRICGLLLTFEIKKVAPKALKRYTYCVVRLNQMYNKLSLAHIFQPRPQCPCTSRYIDTKDAQMHEVCMFSKILCLTQTAHNDDSGGPKLSGGHACMTLFFAARVRLQG